MITRKRILGRMVNQGVTQPNHEWARLEPQHPKQLIGAKSQDRGKGNGCQAGSPIGLTPYPENAEQKGCGEGQTGCEEFRRQNHKASRMLRSIQEEEKVIVPSQYCLLAIRNSHLTR
jgi:hypothetical protein